MKLLNVVTENQPIKLLHQLSVTKTVFPDCHSALIKYRFYNRKIPIQVT